MNIEARKKVFVIAIVTLFIVFTRIAPLLPFDARPGGDANLAVYWGNDIIQSQDLPNVEQSWEFNEQPRDYSRPILYVLAALPTLVANVPIVDVIAWMSIIGSLALIGLVAAIAYRLTPSWQVAVIVALLASVAQPWQRYIFPVGYHFQNIFGELLVLLLLYIVIEILRRPKKVALYMMAGMTLGSTFLFHQLSTFIEVLFLGVLGIWLLALQGKRLRISRRTGLLGLGVIVFLGFIFWKIFGNSVYWELRSFLTVDSRYRSEVNGFFEAFRLIFVGAIISLSALVVLIKQRVRVVVPVAALFLTVVIAMFGPVYGFNVPPTRVANFLTGPAIILVALGLDHVGRRLRASRAMLPASLILGTILIVGISSYAHAYDTNRKGGVRSSQLTVHEENIATWLTSQPDGKVIYDYDTYEQGIWIMPLTDRYTYASVSNVLDIFGPYVSDPSIARKVEVDKKLLDLLHNPNISNEQFTEIASEYEIKYFVVRSLSRRNVAKRMFLQLAYEEGPIGIYTWVEPASSR